MAEGAGRALSYSKAAEWPIFKENFGHLRAELPLAACRVFLLTPLANPAIVERNSWVRTNLG
jgi:hypothetical protein